MAKEGVVETDDESVVGFEAECEAFTTLEDGAGTCSLPSGDSEDRGRQTQRVGNEMWLLDTGVSGHFPHDSTQLLGCAEYNTTLRCVGSATYPIEGTGSLEIYLQSGGGWLLSAFLKWDTCQASSTTNVVTTECWC